MAISGFFGGAGNMINSFLHPEEGYEKAGNQLQKYYVDAQGQLKPLIEQGQSQYNRLNTQANMLDNPVNLENQWAQSYQTSPYAQTLMDQSKTSGLDAASSMGLLGSSAALHNIQQGAGEIMQSDRQQYMNDLMNKYLASIGIGQSIYGTGAGAITQSSQNALNQGTSMAQMKYGQQNAPGEMLAKILGTAANTAINYQTGGAVKAAAAGA